ncbi:hypothetical protein ACQ4PT_013089 [Festuca glaucescens]
MGYEVWRLSCFPWRWNSIQRWCCKIHSVCRAGGKPLLELNRVLRPGGFFIWSATPVYREEKRDQDDWNGMLLLIVASCQLLQMKQTTHPFCGLKDLSDTHMYLMILLLLRSLMLIQSIGNKSFQFQLIGQVFVM